MLFYYYHHQNLSSARTSTFPGNLRISVGEEARAESTLPNIFLGRPDPLHCSWVFITAEQKALNSMARNRARQETPQVNLNYISDMTVQTS
jgi:hypothetical protein